MSTAKKRGLVDVSNVAPTATAVPTKKPRKKAVTAKSLGLTKEEYDRVKPAPIRKSLKAVVKKLARQVDADWHDGYEEQSETKGEWFEAIGGPLQAVLDVGVAKGAALSRCNEVLKIVADSYRDLLACPCRCDTQEDLSEMDGEFDLDLPWGGTYRARSGGQVDAWSYVWVALLRVHAAAEGADEALLLRCIKDAHDNMDGADLAKLPGILYDQDDDDFDESNLKDGADAPDGTKLDRLVKGRASEWKGLPTTRKVHRMRRAIDRRFDGTPERRTRDYHLYDSDDECGYGGYGGGRGSRDCVIM